MQRVLVFTIEDKIPKIGLWQPHAVHEWSEINVEGEMRSDGKLFETLTALLQKEYVHLSQITHIGVLAGPASYTQLRSLVSTANTIAWVRGLPIFSLAVTDTLPNDLPTRIGMAHVNQPIEPIYPSEIA